MGLGQIWVGWAWFSYCWVGAGLVQGTKTGSGAKRPNPGEGEQSGLDLRELGSGESNQGLDLREPRLEEPRSKRGQGNAAGSLRCTQQRRGAAVGSWRQR
jgi:hypothetical protein